MQLLHSKMMRILRQRRDLIASALLIAVIALIYAPVFQAGFVTFDDFDYVVTNPHLRYGFSWPGVRWAFASAYATNWHPITWLSHMFDCQLFGLNAGWHHLTNVALHATNSALLFILLRRMTKVFWPCAVVALLFAVHPLRVESVAWISERKDVLSAFFGLVSIFTYVGYCESSRAGARSTSRGLYALSLITFLLALMSKPMLVSLPVLMVLVDYWPLQRLARATLRHVVMEKIPFVTLSAVVSWIAIVSHKAATVDAFPLEVRFANAIFSVLFYIRKTLFPVDLSVFYGYPTALSGIALAIFLVGVVFALVLWQRSRQPWLFAGWFWFIVALLPVIGIIQTGAQSMADRYTYFPSIGLYTAVVWGAAYLLRTRLRQTAAVSGVCLVAMSFCYCARVQASYWHDSVSLFQASLLNEDCLDVRINFAAALTGRHYFNQAERQLVRCMNEGKENWVLQYRYATVLALQNRREDALPYFAATARLRPEYGDTYIAWGDVLDGLNREHEAEEKYQAGLKLKPEFPPAYYSYGKLLTKTGRVQEAALIYSELLSFSPNDAEANLRLGNLLMRQNEWMQAAEYLRRSIHADPNDGRPFNDMAWVLANADDSRTRNSAQAVTFAEQACKLSPNNAAYLDTLGVCYAAAGRYADAIRVTELARQLARQSNETNFVGELSDRLRLYSSNTPFTLVRGKP